MKSSIKVLVLHDHKPNCGLIQNYQSYYAGFMVIKNLDYSSLYIINKK